MITAVSAFGALTALSGLLSARRRLVVREAPVRVPALEPDPEPVPVLADDCADA